MTDDQPRWMHERSYTMEDLTDLHGNQMHLPAILRHAFCHVCRCMVVKAGLSSWQRSAIGLYIRAGLIRFRDPATNNTRPVCRQCSRDAQGACNANDV